MTPIMRKSEITCMTSYWTGCIERETLSEVPAGRGDPGGAPDVSNGRGNSVRGRMTDMPLKLETTIQACRPKALRPSMGVNANCARRAQSQEICAPSKAGPEAQDTLQIFPSVTRDISVFVPMSMASMGPELSSALTASSMAR